MYQSAKQINKNDTTSKELRYQIKTTVNVYVKIVFKNLRLKRLLIQGCRKCSYFSHSTRKNNPAA